MNDLPPRASAAANPWIARREADPSARVRLFCFPHAGGGASTFRRWPLYLPAEVEVCAVQLPGRENRRAEAPLQSLPTLVQHLAEALRPQSDKPFALFGHSMGALVAFQLARALRDQDRPVPFHLFVAGHNAPQLPRKLDYLAGLDDEGLIEELKRLEGTPKSVLKHRELMQLLLPPLKADFALCARYTYRPGDPLPCPITAMGGRQDPLTDLPGLEAWRAQTRGAFAVRMVPGDHFFPATHRALVLRMLAEELLPG